MTQQTINIGSSANDRSGDPLRTAFSKVNANFSELYAAMGADVQIPVQTGNSGKYLTTSGSALSWSNVSQLVNSTYSLTLGSDGTLNLPQAPSAGAAVIQPSSTTYGIKLVANGNIWTLGTNGSLTFPDTSVQTTAWLGYVNQVNSPGGSSYTPLSVNSDHTVSLPISNSQNFTSIIDGSDNSQLTIAKFSGSYNRNNQGGVQSSSVATSAINLFRDGHITLTTNDGNTPVPAFTTYTFSNTGNFTVPTSITFSGDSSVQTTAWTGILPSPTYSGSNSIGNVTPAPLNLNNTGSAGQIKTQLTLINTAGNGNTGSAIDFYTYTDQGNGVPGARLQSIDNNNYSANFSIALKGVGNAGNNTLTTTWTFGADASLTFPDTSVQTTAYTATAVKGLFSVTTNSASGSGALSYSNGVFSFTPPVIPTVPTYTVSTAAASGVGSLSLSGTVFTFTPAATVTASTITGTSLNNTVVTFASTTTTQTVSIAGGVTASGQTNAINIGTGGAAGSTTNIGLGSINSVAGALGTITHYGNTVLSSGSLTFSGDMSRTAWTTSGIRHVSVPAVLTDTTSTGTVANAYTNNFGGNTIAASNTVTFTNYGTVFLNSPTAGTNVTITNPYSLITAGNVLVGSTGTGTITAVAATATTSSTAASLGYIGMPQQSKSSAYTTVIGDAGKHIYVTATATITIDSNANVAYPIGTTIAFIAAAGATVTIAITSDTMYLGGTGTTGSRTLAAYGMATAVKVTSTAWFINGTGLT